MLDNSEFMARQSQIHEKRPYGWRGTRRGELEMNKENHGDHHHNRPGSRDRSAITSL